MNAISIFCGSSSGHDAAFLEQARKVGETLAEQQISLIYGGAQVGLMGAVADGALSKNGTVIGVIPRFLAEKEIAHDELSALMVVETMHERKLKMCDLCEGAIALPGGYGTLEELFEMLTWGQLGLHQYPIGLLNVNGYYDALLILLDSMTQQGLLRQANREMLLVGNNIEDLLKKMHAYRPTITGKWDISVS